VLSNEKIGRTFGILLPEWKTSLVKIMAALDDFKAAPARYFPAQT
jgi:hypothetical protein